MALIVVAYMFGLCRCFDRLMKWRIEEDKLANPQFPFPNVRLFLKKSKYKSVNSVTTEVFRGDYLILSGFKQTGVVCSCSLRLLACASSISYATVTLCFLLPVIFFSFVTEVTSSTLNHPGLTVSVTESVYVYT